MRCEKLEKTSYIYFEIANLNVYCMKALIEVLKFYYLVRQNTLYLF